MNAPPSPLTGQRVLDLSQAIAGPLVGRILADLGADVVKVEWPDGDVTNRFGPMVGGRTGLFTHMNAGKRGLRLDLKDPSSVELITRLARRADVVIENFRPGVLARAGLGYAELSRDNERLVMASVSGFGQSGPEAGRASFAPVIHAESGLLARQAAADGRPLTDLAMSIADEVTALHTTVAVLAALQLRATTGRGQHIDMSMLEAMVATDDHVSDAIDNVTEPADTRGYVWDTAVGAFLLSVDHRTLWKRIVATAGITDGLAPDATVEQKAAARTTAIASWMRSFTDRASLLTALDAARIPWAEVRTAATLLASPSLRARDVVAQVDDHAGAQRGVIRMPYRFSEATSDVRGPAPRPPTDRGEHHDDVVRDWLTE